jgi:8-oxo-dGTP pyrophosphatase MutT (NUDIX family)
MLHPMLRFPVSVKAVVEVDGRVPLPRNARCEWELPGGRLEAGEELEATAEREVLEELGLAVECRALIDAWTYRPRAPTPRSWSSSTTVLSRTPADRADTLNWSSEHSDAQWFDVVSLAAVEMPELYKRSIRKAAHSRADA